MKASEIIEKILFEGTTDEQVELFSFDDGDAIGEIHKKFNYFSRFFYTRYFFEKPSPKHKLLIRHYIECYLGRKNFMIKGFRNCGKTAMMKLLMVFFLLCDKRTNPRKYIKVLCRDPKNSKQITTDVYNMLLEAIPVFGNMFEKEGDKKREETMSSFTTKDGRKMTAGSVGQSQRGSLQDSQRPDFIWFDDIEDVDSIASQAITISVINKIEEAINGMAKKGSYVCTANYIFEYGSVTHIANKSSVEEMLFPILDVKGKPTWESAYPIEECHSIKKDAKDWFGEYMCDPTKSSNKFFDFDKIDAALKECVEPISESAGVKYWVKYKPNHRYGQGSDHSMGIGLDANTLAGFDFNTGELAYTYFNNEITPDLSAHEFARVGREFGNCIYGWENNNDCGGIVTTTLKDTIGYANMFRKREYDRQGNIISEKLGWKTDSKTKVTMYMEFRTAWNDGLVKIYDENVLKEMKAYSNDDLSETTTGLATRHFDLLTAVVIAWQMNRYAEANGDDEWENIEDEPIYSDIGI
jgi:hypothetical protein